MLEVGQKLFLNCLAYADSKLEYQWFLNGKELIYGTNQDLVIEQVQMSDQGVYVCCVKCSNGASVLTKGAEVVGECSQYLVFHCYCFSSVFPSFNPHLSSLSSPFLVFPLFILTPPVPLSPPPSLPPLLSPLSFSPSPPPISLLLPLSPLLLPSPPPSLLLPFSSYPPSLQSCPLDNYQCQSLTLLHLMYPQIKDVSLGHQNHTHLIIVNNYSHYIDTPNGNPTFMMDTHTPIMPGYHLPQHQMEPMYNNGGYDEGYPPHAPVYTPTHEIIHSPEEPVGMQPYEPSTIVY